MIKKRLLQVYNLLYAYFGPQSWWPGDSPFEIMIGAILTQNTAWSNVEQAIVRIQKKKLLDPYSLYALPHRKLAELIKPAGYFNVKSIRIRSFLEYFIKTYEGDAGRMQQNDVVSLRQELLNVHGIGPETADSILLYALQKPIFVVDAYTKRIFSRHHFAVSGADYHQIQQLCMRHLPLDTQLFNEYHALIVATGKHFCKKTRYMCQYCPLYKISTREENR